VTASADGRELQATPGSPGGGPVPAIRSRAVAFPRRLLNEGEEVILDLRPHWAFFLGRALVLLLAVAGLIAVAALGANDIVLLIVGVVVLAALVRLVARYVVWTTSEFVVTTDRLILRSGIVSKRGIEIPLERVNTIFFNQRLRERLLRYGDLVVESGGERGRQVISDVPHPERVQSVIHGAMEDEEDSREVLDERPAARNDRESVLDQIDRLDQLRQRGVISQAEFETKKAQLLERL
jgi:uncharacterized membrane protein YdbT with pleckstrin-like domain